MPKQTRQKGTTDVTVNIFIPDSSSTVGAGLTGLVFNSSGLTCYYARARSAATSVTLVTQTVTGAHTDGGFVQIDATNMPGWYRLDLPDAVFAAGQNSVGVHLKGATNMVPVPIEFQLSDIPSDPASQVWGASLPDLYGAGTAGNILGNIATTTLQANMTQISGDATAADNLEAQYDGTGVSGDTFPSTQLQIDSLAVGSTAINAAAESAVVTQGTETNTYTATEGLNSVFHSVNDTASGLDFYYQFDATSGGTGAAVKWNGYLQGQGDTVAVQAYDWNAAGWNQIGTLTGSNGTAVVERTFDLLRRHTGTGANVGKVRIRFFAATDQGAEIFTDRIFTQYALFEVAMAALTNNAVTEMRAAVWDVTTSSHTTAGTTGLAQHNLITPVSDQVWNTPHGLYTNPTTFGGVINHFGQPRIGTVVATGNPNDVEIASVSADDEYNGWIVAIYDGTGAGQVRIITDSTAATNLLAVAPNWTTNPDGTSKYMVIPPAGMPGSIEQVGIASDAGGGGGGLAVNMNS